MNPEIRLRRPRRICLALLALLVQMYTAHAAPVGGGDEPPRSCLDKVSASLSVSQSSVRLGQPVQLSWNVQANGCSGLFYSVTGVSNPGASGSRPFTPLSDSQWTLGVRLGGQTRMWHASTQVVLPTDANGNVNVTITADNQVTLFAQAIASANATVYVASDVSLDLSRYDTLHIAPGVRLFGGRSLGTAGARLFTTRIHQPLFAIGERLDADNIRISGFHIQGGNGFVVPSSEKGSNAIQINSSINIDIDNNDIGGFSGASISVADNRGDRIRRSNGAGAVRIRNNYLHNSQRIDGGYGVVVGDGAYALIERNVFNNNRHAIAGDGSNGSGYFAYRNLVLDGGGHHESAGFSSRTHQIDMHGQESCNGFPTYCGVAGEYMDIRHNTITYTAGSSIKIRGTPTLGVDVAKNSFARPDAWGGGYVFDSALVQIEGHNLREWDNRFGNVLPPLQYVCDFDQNQFPLGTPEGFLATGETWWLRRRSDQIYANEDYVFLNTSRRTLAELSLGDRNGDQYCDVTAGSTVSPNGTGVAEAPQRVELVWATPGSNSLRVSAVGGGNVLGETYPVLPAGRRLLGVGDFDGDGDGDLLTQETGNQPRNRVVILQLQAGQVAGEFSPGFQESGTELAGIADFDGDDTADILWRKPGGQLAMWNQEGKAIEAPVGYRNDHTPAGTAGSAWKVRGTGDFDGDGHADILWRSDAGDISIWLMVGSVHAGNHLLPAINLGADWQIQGVGDFDADGKSDILWQAANGAIQIWFKGSSENAWFYQAGAATDTSWKFGAVADVNADGRSDILWRHAGGSYAYWIWTDHMNFHVPAFQAMGTEWTLQGVMSTY